MLVKKTHKVNYFIKSYLKIILVNSEESESKLHYLLTQTKSQLNYPKNWALS